MSLATFEDSSPPDDGSSPFFPENSTFPTKDILTSSLLVTHHPLHAPFSFNMSAMTIHGCTMQFYDFSRHTYPGDTSMPAMWTVALKCAFMSVISVLAITGNMLLIAIVIFSTKMRTTTNYYIVNLAIADLIIACLPTWIYLIKTATPGWILGAFLCKVNVFLQVCPMCTMSFTMIAIAGDRFFAIVFPLKSRVTQRRVKVVMAVIWTLGAAIGVPPLLYYQYTERQWANYLETFCSEQWPMVVLSDGSCDGGKTAEQYYWAVILAALNWIPMLMMTIMYTVIIQRLQCGRVTHNGNDAMSAVQQRSAKRVVTMLFVLLVTFMVCTIPFQVSTIYEVYKKTTTTLPAWYNSVYFCAISLMYSHSAINPILYGAMNQTFRSGFRHLMARLTRRKNSSSRSQYSTHDTAIKPNISIINTNGPDASLASSITELISCSSRLSFAALKDSHDTD